MNPSLDCDIQTLSERAGVDFVSLRKKYEKIKLSAALEPKKSNDEKVSSDFQKLQEQYDSLDKYVVCLNCNGIGIIKFQYNHMVLEKTCPECHGECIQERELETLGIKINDASQDKSEELENPLDEVD